MRDASPGAKNNGKKEKTMKLATTTGDFGHYFRDNESKIRALHRAGFRHIDLSLYGDADPASVFMQDGWEKEVTKIGSVAAGLGMDFVQSHAPGGNPLLEGDSRDLLLAATIRSLEICAMLGIPNTVVHAGWADDLLYADREAEETYFERNMAFFRELIPTMEKTGVMVLVENTTHANMGDRWYLYTGQEMKDFLAYADHPLFGACWDTGHANVEGHQYEDLVTLGKDLRAIHFNDNRGGGDEHVMPYLGTMSVDEALCGMRDAGYDGVFTFECDSTTRPASYWQGDRRRWKEEKAAEAPLRLREALERALYICGEEILAAYGYPVE